jgi:hypothetical protein
MTSAIFHYKSFLFTCFILAKTQQYEFTRPSHLSYFSMHISVSISVSVYLLIFSSIQNFPFPLEKSKKVKVTLVQALRLCTVRTARRGSSGIALLFHDHSTRRVWGVSGTLRPLFTPGKDPVPFVQEAGWVPGPVWTCAENFAPTGIRSPYSPARSQSLYRLSYLVISLREQCAKDCNGL